TVTAQGVSSGLWRSVDGGATWMHLTNGLPAPAKFNRATLAMAPSDPNVIYLQVAGSDENVLGIFRTSDGGNTWHNIGGSHFDGEGQMTYGNSIVVHPTDPNHVICGGVDLHRNTNGGNTWKQITHWDATRGDADYAHADHHAVLMPAAAAGRGYDANDGGGGVSDDGGKAGTKRSKGFAGTRDY